MTIMKAIKNLCLFVLFFSLIAFNLQVANAQKTKTAKTEIIKNLIDSQRYVFHAQYVMPANGSQRFLTSDYLVTVLKDSVISYLPFFGRAYSAPINPTDGGIKFTSTNFWYKLENKKKGGWDIIIKPKDAPDVQQFALSVFENGNASLQVISINRQPISFNGYVEGIKINNAD